MFYKFINFLGFRLLTWRFVKVRDNTLVYRGMDLSLWGGGLIIGRHVSGEVFVEGWERKREGSEGGGVREKWEGRRKWKEQQPSDSVITNASGAPSTHWWESWYDRSRIGCAEVQEVTWSDWSDRTRSARIGTQVGLTNGCNQLVQPISKHKLRLIQTNHNHLLKC